MGGGGGECFGSIDPMSKKLPPHQSLGSEGRSQKVRDMKLWRIFWGAVIIFTVISNIWNVYCIRSLCQQQEEVIDELPKFIYQIIKEEGNK